MSPTNQMRSKNQPQRHHTTGQVRAIFGEARRCGLDNDTLHELVADVLVSTGGSSDRIASIKTLTFAEAEAVIQKLKGKSFVPLRTLQYRRQQAGVKQVVEWFFAKCEGLP